MAYEIVIGRSAADRKEFDLRGTIFLGKHYVKMGQTTSLSSDILLDVNRSHVVFVVGKRGCLIGETMIFTDKGYKQIIKFNEKEDKILSFNKEKKDFEWEKAELLKYPVHDEKLLKIEFYDGRSINLTKEHPLLMNYGKYAFWRMAQQLKIGNKIVIPTELPEVKRDKESLRIARILGFVLSDGTISKRKGKWKDGRGYWYDGIKSRLRIFNNCPEVLELAKKDLEEEFGLYVKRYKRNDCNCEVIQSLHARVVDKVHKLGVPLGNKAGIIRVPEIVWQSSNKFKADFIAALFSCDGYISKNGYIIYACKSKKFLEDLQFLLSHFNIESSLREKNVKYKGKVYKNYRLFITDNFSTNNFRSIGFFNKFKQKRQKHRKRITRRRKTFYFSDKLVCKKIKNIEEVTGIKEVYDLSVNKNHSFIANGIISHNSGKSYSLGVIAEGIVGLPPEVSKNLSVLIFDTMGIFWTMKYPNQKDRTLLKKWGLEGKGLGVRIYTPVGFFDEFKKKGIPTDFPFSIKPSELSSADWCMTFDIDANSPPGVLIERIINNLRKTKKNFSINDIINAVHEDKRSGQDVKDIVENQFLKTEGWGLFSEKATPIDELAAPGKATILDISCYAAVPGTWGIRALVIGIVSQKLFMGRMTARKTEEFEAIHKATRLFSEEEGPKKQMPMVWLFLDEAHEFLPNKGKTDATDALITVLREGREPGISLVLASQQPGKIHTDVMTQADVVISHRLTAKIDVEALGLLMQSYLRKGLDAELNQLPKVKGAAIIFDDMNEKLYPMKVRPRFSWHGGAAPVAVRKLKKKEFGL